MPVDNPTHFISITVAVSGADQWAQIFGQFSELVENLGSKYPGATVSSQQYEPEDTPEDTLFKVHTALMRAGMPLRDIAGAISEMRNAGILFRERD